MNTTAKKIAALNHRTEVLCRMLSSMKKGTEANLSPKELLDLRNFLEDHLIELSKVSFAVPLKREDVRENYLPVIEYFDRKNCREPFDACIQESCFWNNPDCFSEKITANIRELEKILRERISNRAPDTPAPAAARQTVRRPSAPEPIVAPPPPVSAATHTHQHLPQSAAEAKTILVVDDDRLQTNLLKYKLFKDGYRVESAVNGIEALDMAQKQAFDLIISDVMMPGMDGFMFIKRIKEMESLSEIPIIFLSSAADERKIIKGLALGANDYLTKPYSPTELSVRIKKLLFKG